MNLLLISLPGIFPSFPAVGIELIAHGLRAKGHQVHILNGHLYILQHMDEFLLKSMCLKNVWDLFYSDLVFPREKVGLDDKNVIGMLTSPSYDYNFTKDEINFARDAISRFNEHFIETMSSMISDSLIGFSIQNNQLLVAKYFSRRIKALCGENLFTIIGGASIRYDLGRYAVSEHEEFDFASQEDGIYELDMLLNGNPPRDIAMLFHRDDKGKIRIGSSRQYFETPIDEHRIDYADFYTLRKPYERECDLSIFHPFDSVPGMLSMGCRWSKCRFCNIRNTYQDLPISRAVDSIARRTEVNTIPKVFLLDLSQPASDSLDGFFTELRRRQIRCLFGAVLRCDISRDDLILFKEHGLDICQIGIESFSDRLLRKMNKGIRMLDIARTLTTCKEIGIEVEGNLIINLPWEKEEDVIETKRHLQILSHLPLPRPISFKLAHGSPYFKEVLAHFRTDWAPEDVVRCAYPPLVRESVETMYYSSKNASLRHEALWVDVLRKLQRYSLDPPELHYEAFADGLLFHDTREIAPEKLFFIDDELSVKIYEYCKDNRSFEEITAHFSHLSSNDLLVILEKLVEKHVTLQSNNQFLSIAIKR